MLSKTVGAERRKTPVEVGLSKVCASNDANKATA